MAETAGTKSRRRATEDAVSARPGTGAALPAEAGAGRHAREGDDPESVIVVEARSVLEAVDATSSPRRSTSTGTSHRQDTST